MSRAEHGDGFATFSDSDVVVCTVVPCDIYYSSSTCAKQPARVRFHFLKASRVVHPDRNNTASDEQKFIATAVFDILKQAYEAFEAAELKPS